MKKFLGWTVAAVVSLGGVAACGSSSKPASTTAKSSTATTAAGGGESSGSASVDAFCKQVDDLAVKLKAAIADPSSADAASISASATKLASDGAALISANPNDSAKIQACVQKLTDVAAP